ncbi:MAG: hypothetical protein HRU20_00305 [Pseudomonadales bacterium]|nr:hypothetical protein [Pseudomonadales bacterium]
MVEKPRKSAAKKKNSYIALEASDLIKEQTKKFLEKGGKIEKIIKGASGQHNIPAAKK